MWMCVCVCVCLCVCGHVLLIQPGSFSDLLTDNYVHRLVQNKSDGKLVEVSGMTGAVGLSSIGGCTLKRIIL